MEKQYCVVTRYVVEERVYVTASSEDNVLQIAQECGSDDNTVSEYVDKLSEDIREASIHNTPWTDWRLLKENK